MRYRCPYCKKPGEIKGYKSSKIIEDSEMLIAICSSCKRNFSVAVTISEEPESIDFSDLEKARDAAIAKLIGNGKVY